MKNKRGQQILGLSFGVIFSIILIVFFIFITVIVINSFLSAQKCAEIGIFLDRFQTDIKKTWNAQADSHVFKGNLPSRLDYVCFMNLTESVTGQLPEIGRELTLFEGRRANLFFYPYGKTCEIQYKQINHLDLKAITARENPYCIPIEGGRISIRVEKGLDDRFVRVKDF